MRLFDLLAELLDLIAQRREQRAEFFLATFRKGLGLLIEDVGGERFKLVGERLLGGFEQDDFFRHVLAFVVQFGFELADACSLVARCDLVRLQVGSRGIALGSKALDGSGTLGSNGFKPGTGGGNGLGFGKLSTNGSNRLGGFTIALFEQIPF
ncbi:MAG TPA: hypothetical protein VMR02_13810 [Terracidiphilus sp.]|nr:hypothetical protein [Terracidiphilus sp.]